MNTLVTNLNTSKTLYALLKNVKTVFVWFADNEQKPLVVVPRSVESTIENRIVQIPAFTSEELKTYLIRFVEEVSYNYEENFFYFVDYHAEIKNEKDLPPIFKYKTEVEARANFLIYLLKRQNQSLI